MISTLPTADEINGSQLSWNYEDLVPFEEREIIVTLLANRPTDEPPLEVGEVLSFTASVFPKFDDITPTNNTLKINQPVVNSHDPNDKTMLEGKSITEEMVGDFVNYLIRFENTGSASAINIVVIDTIDQSSFDINSLEIVDASHKCVGRIIEPNIVRFEFEDIQLSHIDSLNDGYIAFKIKTFDHLEIGDQVSNFADIYFDFNEPIRTNTYHTVVKKTTSFHQPSVKPFKVFPNPTDKIIHLDGIDPGHYNVQVLTGQGQKVFNSGQLINERHSLDVEYLIPGIYFIILKNTEGYRYAQKFVKQK